MKKSFVFTEQEVDEIINYTYYDNKTLSLIISVDLQEIINEEFLVFPKKPWVPYMNECVFNNFTTINILPDENQPEELDLNKIYWLRGIDVTRDFENVLRGNMLMVTFHYIKVHTKIPESIDVSLYDNLYYVNKSEYIPLKITRSLQNFSIPLMYIIRNEIKKINNTGEFQLAYLYYNPENIVSQNEIAIMFVEFEHDKELDFNKVESFDNYIDAIKNVVTGE